MKFLLKILIRRIDTNIRSPGIWNMVSCFNERYQTGCGDKNFLEKLVNVREQNKHKRWINSAWMQKVYF